MIANQLSTKETLIINQPLAFLFRCNLDVFFSRWNSFAWPFRLWTWTSTPSTIATFVALVSRMISWRPDAIGSCAWRVEREHDGWTRYWSMLKHVETNGKSISFMHIIVAYTHLITTDSPGSTQCFDVEPKDKRLARVEKRPFLHFLHIICVPLTLFNFGVGKPGKRSCAAHEAKPSKKCPCAAPGCSPLHQVLAKVCGDCHSYSRDLPFPRKHHSWSEAGSIGTPKLRLSWLSLIIIRKSWYIMIHLPFVVADLWFHHWPTMPPQLDTSPVVFQGGRLC